MLPQIPQLSDYDVSPVNGFLPTEAPLDFLPDPYYQSWETTVASLQALILTKRIRRVVDALPVLSTRYLVDEREWRRAYSILAFIAHSYIWGGNAPADRVPPSISVPFLSCCRHLELPPVATYAGLVLWNWRPLDPAVPVDNLENIFTLNTMTGSLDESWFYLVSVAIEACAAPTIPLMIRAFEAVRLDDGATVTECLRSFAEHLDKFGALLQRMYEECDPHVFYHRIRPYLAGSKNMADAGLPNGVIFDDGTDAPQRYVQFSGGSNAQSSVIQFFDLALGVEHRPTGEKAKAAPGAAPSSASSSPSSQDAAAPPAPQHNFITEMRTYMPGPHRRFLEAISSVANVRPYVRARPHDRALTTAYDACLAMLRAFRDKHIQLVSRYIIVKSRETRTRSSSRSRPGTTNLATGSAAPFKPTSIGSVGAERVHGGAASNDKNSNLRGTGGTALIPFLKQARDETGEPAIDAWARRLLNNGPSDATSVASGFGGSGNASGPVGARMTKVGEHASGEMEIVGLAGVWTADDSEGGICHW